jgi:pimeloyl-ACP methyl ester carboxylesterase
MVWITRNGARLHYRVSGSGPVIALQHALTSDSSAFEAVGWRGELVAAGFACVTMDSIGHGKSDSPDDPDRYALSEQADDLLAVMDAVGAERFGLAGYSMGAWIATGVLAKAGQRVTTAVLGGWDPIAGARLFSALADDREARAEEFRMTAKALAAMRPAQGAPNPRQIGAFLAAYHQLFEPLPPLEVLVPGGGRLAFFCGERDPYLPNIMRGAESLGMRFVATPGDHVRAFFAAEAKAFVGACFGDASHRACGYFGEPTSCA